MWSYSGKLTNLNENRAFFVLEPLEQNLSMCSFLSDVYGNQFKQGMLLEIFVFANPAC